MREIESEVLKSEKLVQGGQRRLDYSNQRTAEQASKIREKINQTRQIYEELQRELKNQLENKSESGSEAGDPSAFQLLEKVRESS